MQREALLHLKSNHKNSNLNIQIKIIGGVVGFWKIYVHSNKNLLISEFATDDLKGLEGAL